MCLQLIGRRHCRYEVSTLKIRLHRVFHFVNSLVVIWRPIWALSLKVDLYEYTAVRGYANHGNCVETPSQYCIETHTTRLLRSIYCQTGCAYRSISVQCEDTAPDVEQM